MIRRVLWSVAVVGALLLTAVPEAVAGRCYRGGYGGYYPSHRSSYYYGGGYGYRSRGYYGHRYHHGYRGFYGHPGYYGRSGVSFSIGF